MAFEEITIGELLHSQAAASQLIQEAGIKRRPFSHLETFVLQAASHALLDADSFYATQISDITRLALTTVGNTLFRFEQATLVTSLREPIGIGSHKGNKRRLYFPTEVGANILQIFQP